MQKHVGFNDLKWIHKPLLSVITKEKLILETEPFTNLHYNGRCAEALMPVEGKTYCLKMRVDYNCHNPLDQCGLVLYEGDCRKAVFGMEYHDGELSTLACTVFHSDGSDRNERNMASGIRWMYYRIWVRENLVLLEYSFNGRRFSELRRFSVDRKHRFRIGIYACSPMNSSFDCIYSEMKVLKEEEEENEY